MVVWGPSTADKARLELGIIPTDPFGAERWRLPVSHFLVLIKLMLKLVLCLGTIVSTKYSEIIFILLNSSDIMPCIVIESVEDFNKYF